jgi:HK97 family phage major capsid protein
MPKPAIETPSSLPQLTRVVPLELTRVKREKTAEQIASEEERKRKAAEAAARGETEPDSEDPDEADEDEYEMSFSSETPVPRWFGDEILDHSAEAVDMTRAAAGLAYLVDHNTGEQVGIIRNFRLEGKKTRGKVQFSRSARAQDIKRDVDDGIRPFTSIGYRVMEMVLEKENKDDEGTHRTYRITRWMPMEASTVAVPADYTVGPGRAAAKEEFPVQVRSAIQSAAQPQKITVEVRSMNPKEVAEVLRLCETHKIDRKRAIEIVESEGMTVDTASRQILAEVGKRDGRQVETPAAENTPMLQLTEAEQKRYIMCRGLNAKISEVETGKRTNCFELEISDEIEKRHDGKKHGGLFVPWQLRVDPQQVRNAIERYGAEMLTRVGVSTALTAGTATKGSELVFTEPGPFIQFLYNRMRLKELGAETISGLQGNIAFPKQTGKASGSWVGENPGADVADSNLTLSQVPMSPKTYQSSSAYSRQLLAQAVVDIDNLMRSDLARDCALAIDLAGINGNPGGSGDDPTGILNTTGVQDYTLENDVANGAQPNWNDITKMEELLENVNADQLGDFGWLTTPGIKGLFKRTPRLLYAPVGSAAVNVTGDPIWADNDSIDGYEARSSNQVPKDFTVGTSDGTSGHPKCHALIVGVFSCLINGLWGSGFELVVDPYRLKKQGLIELTTFVLTDWANRYPVAFAAATDALR